MHFYLDNRKYTQNAQYIMAVTIDGREPLYAEMFSAVIDSNMHNRLALTSRLQSNEVEMGY